MGINSKLKPFSEGTKLSDRKATIRSELQNRDTRGKY